MTNSCSKTLDFKNAFKDLCWQIHTERMNLRIYDSKYQNVIEESYKRVLTILGSNESYYDEVIHEKKDEDIREKDDW